MKIYRILVFGIIGIAVFAYGCGDDDKSINCSQNSTPAIQDTIFIFDTVTIVDTFYIVDSKRIDMPEASIASRLFLARHYGDGLSEGGGFDADSIHFPITCYSTSKSADGEWTVSSYFYINGQRHTYHCFLKFNQESSNWPYWSDYHWDLIGLEIE